MPAATGRRAVLPRTDRRAARVRRTFVPHSLAGGRSKREGTARRRRRAQRHSGLQGRRGRPLVRRKTGGRCTSRLDRWQHPGWAKYSSRYSSGQTSRTSYSRCQISRSVYSRGQSAAAFPAEAKSVGACTAGVKSAGAPTAAAIKIGRSLCSSYRVVACDAPSTTCGKLACIVCPLRSGWGKTGMWFATFPSLITLRCNAVATVRG